MIKQEVRKLRSEGKSWDEIIHLYKDHQMFAGLMNHQVRKKMYDMMRDSGHHKGSFQTVNDEKQTSNGWKNGQYTSDRLIEVCETEEITPDLILALHNLDVSRWDVVSYVNNRWHAQKKGNKQMVMYQSKLVAKPAFNKVTFADVESYFEGKEYPTAPQTSCYAYDPDGEVLEIDIADLHSGLLAWGRETGEDYDVKIARERFMSVIDDAVARTEGRGFSKIILALLGDLLHVDNDHQTTTKGTFQQADGRIAKIFEMTLDMLVDAVRELSYLAPVDVVYTSGNHDGTSGWMLIKALQMVYRKDTNVSIDISPNPQKYRIIGRNLIGFVHGDMPVRNLSGWLQVNARKLTKSIDYLEVHSGHRHAQKATEHIQTEDREGVVVRVMPTIASSSTWEHREGYSGSVSTSMCFVWSPTRGLREMWFCNV